MRIKKKLRSWSVSMMALGDPFRFNSSWMVGIPVARPSESFNSLRKSPNRLLR